MKQRLRKSERIGEGGQFRAKAPKAKFADARSLKHDRTGKIS